MKSYQITFLMLICISLLTGIRSLQQNINEKNRLSLQLSTLVTSIASFHYFYMLKSIDKVVSYRYFDWFFTTPILLIDLCILLFKNIPNTIFLSEIILYNTLMLGFGYLGELNKLSKLNSMILGFIPFIMIFFRIYIKKQEENEKNNDYEERKTESFLQNVLSKFNLQTNIFMNNTEKYLFYIFIILWSLYGINHIVTKKNIKETIYNILDLCTKGFFGLYIYYNSWLH